MSGVRTDLVADQVKLAWSSRYLLSNKIIIDRGRELLAYFKSVMANNYRILCNLISTRYPYPNTDVERVHQTINNMIHTCTI